MKKPIDLNSLIDSYKKLPEKSYKYIQKYFDFSIRESEVEQIESLITSLEIPDRYLSYFYVGYKIPQINKEFDLLKFGKHFIVNIEIKGRTSIEKAKNQLIKNKYYLSSINKKIKLFTYISADNQLYFLDEEEELIEVSFKKLKKLLENQELEHYSNIDDLFDPSCFLVSPFNDCDRFIKGEYFLTQQQQEHKKAILKEKSQFVFIEGAPGTGKTLLLYDLAKKYISDYEILIIHSGDLNIGHLKLKNQYNWNIVPAKQMKIALGDKPTAIFIDETQRLYPNQLDYLVQYLQDNRTLGFFSIDPRQILSLREKNYRNLTTLESLKQSKLYKLSDKIRTNKSLGTFIQGLFNLNRLSNCKNIDNVSLHYFDTIDKAKEFSISLGAQGWQIIDYTSQNYNGKNIEQMRLNMGLNAHNVLGQEFDKVIVLIGASFYYDPDGSLSVKGANYYDPERMLYQAITRARKQLMLIIVDNSTFMTKLINKLGENNLLS